VGNNEPDSSLNVIFRGLKKYSCFEYIKGTQDINAVLNSCGNVLIGSYRYYKDDLLYKMKRKFGKNCFCFIHGFNTGNDTVKVFKERYERIYNEGVKLLVSCSYAYKYLRELDLDGFIVPFGVDLDSFKCREKLANGRPIFGMCYQKRKAHRKGADILDSIRKMGYKTKIADDIPNEKLHEFYRSIDCLIVASNDDGRETFCLPIIEAAACGTPTISTPVGCATDVIKNGYNGYIVKNKSEIIDLISNNLNFIEMGKNARSVIEDKWSWDITTIAWDSTIVEVCGE